MMARAERLESEKKKVWWERSQAELKLGFSLCHTFFLSLSSRLAEPSSALLSRLIGPNNLILGPVQLHPKYLEIGLVTPTGYKPSLRRMQKIKIVKHIEFFKNTRNSQKAIYDQGLKDWKIPGMVVYYTE